MQTNTAVSKVFRGSAPAKRALPSIPFNEAVVDDWTAEMLKNATWRYYRYKITHKDKSIKVVRKVKVLAPLPSTALIGAAVMDDEISRKAELSQAEEHFERITQARKKVRKDEIAFFISDMGKCIGSTTSIKDSFERCALGAKTAYFRGVIGCMSLYMQRAGAPLHKAMRLFPDVFDDITIALIESGSNAGSLPKLMDDYGREAIKNLNDNKKIASAYFYPKILFVVGIGVFLALVTFVRPRMQTTYSVLQEVPLSTRIVNGTGLLILHYPIVVLIPIALFFYIQSKMGFVRKSATYQRVILKIPGFKHITRLRIMLRCLKTLSLGLRNGQPTDVLYDLTARASGNIVFAEYFRAVHRRITDGAEAADAYFAERYRLGELGLDLAQRFKIGASTGRPEDRLDQWAEVIDADLNEKLKTLPVLVNTFALIAFLPFLLLLASSVIEPNMRIADMFISMSQHH